MVDVVLQCSAVQCSQCSAVQQCDVSCVLLYIIVQCSTVSPLVFQRIIGHEDVEDDRHEDTEAAREVEEELPANLLDDVTGEAEEHPAELDAKEDADAHPVELGGQEPSVDEGGDDGGEDGRVEAGEEAEDDGDVVAALLGEGGGEHVEEAGEAEAGGEDQAVVEVIVDEEGHDGADQYAGTDDGVDEALREEERGHHRLHDPLYLDAGVPEEGAVGDLVVPRVVPPPGHAGVLLRPLAVDLQAHLLHVVVDAVPVLARVVHLGEGTGNEDNEDDFDEHEDKDDEDDVEKDEDIDHATKGEDGIVLEEGLAEDAEEGNEPGHQESPAAADHLLTTVGCRSPDWFEGSISQSLLCISLVLICISLCFFLYFFVTHQLKLIKRTALHCTHRIAQWLETQPLAHCVRGSIPLLGIKSINTVVSLVRHSRT